VESPFVIRLQSLVGKLAGWKKFAEGADEVYQ
jgi:hypothetical protein